MRSRAITLDTSSENNDGTLANPEGLRSVTNTQIIRHVAELSQYGRVVEALATSPLDRLPPMPDQSISEFENR
jgi:hypothetical protein